MRDAKTVLLKRLAKQSQAALACCGELAKTAREIAKTSAQLSTRQSSVASFGRRIDRSTNRRNALTSCFDKSDLIGREILARE